MLYFDVASVPSLSTGLRSGLTAYATNVPKVGPPATLWLQLCDGRILRIGVEMHDLSGWEEVGTLTFEVVSSAEAPEMVNLPAHWSDVREVQKLVFISDECEAESGFSLCTTSGDLLTVLPGADVYTVAIEASFYQSSFKPENDLAVYVRKEL
jgi:hypothetical protein